MEQLTSPPISATGFAQWLIGPNGYHHPDVPLGSVRLLASTPGALGRLRQPRFTNPATGERYLVPAPTLVEVKKAIGEWTAMLRRSEESRALFFFSGHGAAAGIEHALLLSDIGGSIDSPYEASIKFPAFLNGMQSVAAREQFYFIDSCQTLSEELAAAYGAAGDPLVTPNPRLTFLKDRIAVVFDATIAGKEAFGRKRKPSLFTEALLTALKGGGSDDSSADQIWKIETNTLNRSVQWLVDRAAKREGLSQTPSARQLTSLDFSHLQGSPLTPVGLSCDPHAATGHAVFRSGREKWTVKQRDPLLPLGEHEFRATFSGRDFAEGAAARRISPPFKEVCVPVERRS